MPPKKRDKTDDAGGRRSGALVQRTRDARRSDFVSGALHRKFEAHVTAAQDFFLKGDASAAEREATLALRIRPTAHLFALLAVISESKGKFDRASDFRLLQAFLARDMVLWEELLHDFMSQQLYFKSVVCLQRMSALEKDKVRYRALQLQLADLLIGLSEIRRATNVLVPLWNSSRCRDFEVFALLSSLYFQLGKWASLQRLIESSVKYAFQQPPIASTTAADATADKASTALSAPTQDSSQVSNVGTTQGKVLGAEGELQRVEQSPAAAAGGGNDARVSKRVRFYGMEDEEEKGKRAGASEGIAASSPGFSSPSSLDEFSFDDVLLSSAPGVLSATSSQTLSGALAASATTAAGPTPGGVIHQLYGERVELRTEEQKKNFLTLLNVHAELLNEQGNFTDTVQLLQMAAGCLEVDVTELPPDLLVRLGMAYAFLGGEWEQPCRDVFQHLMEHCSMEDYGDVLLDAAVSLQKVGMHADAGQLYTSLARYHQFAYDRLHRDVSVRESELALLHDTAPMEEVQAAMDALSTLRSEENDVKTVLAAALHGQAQCAYAQESYEEAKLFAERALELEPTHLQARMLLGRYYFYRCADTDAAVAVLAPRESEPAVQRVQLGAFLVQVFQRTHRYVEAIALGVSIFEVLLSTEEDGDTQSVATGTSSRRSTTSYYLPTMTRASSAIIPAASLAGMVSGAAGSSVTARTSFSLAASIRATSSVARQQLSRRGPESLTTTVYGASAAASIAAGWDKKEEQGRLKDTSTIFQFNRKRKQATEKNRRPQPTRRKTDDGTTGGEEEEVAAAMVPKTPAERREAVIAMSPPDFWDGEKPEEKVDEATGKDGTAQERGALADMKDEEEDKNADKPQQDRENEEADAPTATNATVDKNVRKRPRKDKGDEGVRPLPSNYTTLREKERDLEELEEFLTQAEEIVEKQEQGRQSKDATVEGKDEVVVDVEEKSIEEEKAETAELPSLEDVSKQFNDPTMAHLFLDASGFTPGGGVHGIEGREAIASNLWDALGEANNSNNPAAPPLPPGAGPGDRVTLREAMEVLGNTGFIALAVAVVDCYSAVGKFTEARDFAFVSLTHFQQKRRLRLLGSRLARPLRLAVLRAALAAGDSEDAFRVGLRLLQEDAAEEKRREVVELMHSVLNRCKDRTANLYRAVADGHNDPALLVLLASRYYQTRSYTRSLNLYLLALQERPSDIFLNFMVGLSFLFCSHQSRNTAREAAVSAGIYYLSHYQHLRLSLEPAAAVGEVLYNIARALHFLRLHYLCIPLYERVAYDLPVPTECSAALQRAARMNLYFVYRWVSGSRTLALTALQPRTSGSNERGAGQRASSPFAH